MNYVGVTQATFINSGYFRSLAMNPDLLTLLNI